eukprot:TRINITY_DN55317_c0_g1_i1.p1 TRINITY_DN55317_c0_g1~~TRINITY_DN55317_c0_g1_i1.p1  ORF type:complete len:534 (+),score=127.94 TRINITY_DN55317_c0_g1_i1:115-1602(+)
MASELQARLARQRQRADADAPSEAFSKVEQRIGHHAEEPDAVDDGAASEVAQRLARQRKRAEAEAPGEAFSAVEARVGHSQEPHDAHKTVDVELQRRLADARARIGSKLRSKPDKDAPVLTPRAEVRSENVGPPYYNSHYVDKMNEVMSLENHSFKRFAKEVIAAYDADGDGKLNEEESFVAVVALYNVLNLRTPPRQLVMDVVHTAAKPQSEDADDSACIGQEEFACFFEMLMKKVKFSSLIGKAEQATVAVTPVKPTTLSECPDFHVGWRVEIIAFRWCYPTYADGAKKLRLKEFQAEEGRVPPQHNGLNVVGSFCYLGETRDGLEHGCFVVGVQDEASGLQYLVDSRGLQVDTHRSDDSKSRRRVHDCAQPAGAAGAIRRLQKLDSDGGSLAGEDEDEVVSGGGATRKRRTRTSLVKPDELAAWLEEPFWACAVEACHAEDGCIEVAQGDWLYVQFVGRGDDDGWSYGTNEDGTASGWFPTQNTRRDSSAAE